MIGKKLTGRIRRPKVMPREAVAQAAKTVTTPSRGKKDRAQLLTDPAYLFRSAGVQRSTIELNRMVPLDVVQEGLGVNHKYDVTTYSAALITQETAGDVAIFDIKKLPNFDFSEYAGDDAIDAGCGAFVPSSGDFAVQYRIFFKNMTGTFAELRFRYDGQDIYERAVGTKARIDTRWCVSTQLYPRDYAGSSTGYVNVDLEIESHAGGHVAQVRISPENGDLAGNARTGAGGSLYRSSDEYRAIIESALAIFDLEIVSRAGALPMIFLTRIV